MDLMQTLWEVVYTAAGLLWKAFWALALGYAISAVIQVFVSRAVKRRSISGPPARVRSPSRPSSALPLPPAPSLRCRPPGACSPRARA